MDDRDVLAEVSTWHLRGRVYYQHEAGLLFSADLLVAGGLEQVPQLEAEPPAGIEPYHPRQGSRAEARLDAWTDLVDVAVEQARTLAAEQLAALGIREGRPCR